MNAVSHYSPFIVAIDFIRLISLHWVDLDPKRGLTPQRPKAFLIEPNPSTLGGKSNVEVPEHLAGNKTHLVQRETNTRSDCYITQLERRTSCRCSFVGQRKRVRRYLLYRACTVHTQVYPQATALVQIWVALGSLLDCGMHWECRSIRASGSID